MIFAATISSAQKKSSTATTTPVEGVVYALPQTGIRVHIKATRERYVHGPYQVYAQKMLGIENAPSADGDKWNMDEMTIEVFSEPDPEQVHKAMGPIASLVSQTETGIISGINSGSNASETLIQTQNFLTRNLEKQVKFDDLSIWPFHSPSDSTKNFKMVSKNMDQKAAEAAETIFNIRNSRFALLTNADDEPLPDGKSFEVMVAELSKMESNYLSLFIGKSTTQSYEFSFDFIPGPKSAKGEVLFRYSEDRGVLPKSDLSGKPIVIDVIKSEGLAAKQSGLSKSDNPNAGKSGLYYRMPGIGEIRIMDGSTKLAGARASIAQFGTIASVPEEMLTEKYKFEFFPQTGAIKSIIENQTKQE